MIAHSAYIIFDTILMIYRVSHQVLGVANSIWSTKNNCIL